MRRFTQQLSVYLLCFLIGIFVTQYWSLPSEGKNKNSQKVTKPSRGQDISDGEAILREERVRNSEDIKIVEDEIEEADVLKVADNQDKQIHQGHIPKDRPEKEKIVKVQEQQQKHEKVSKIFLLMADLCAFCHYGAHILLGIKIKILLVYVFNSSRQPLKGYHLEDFFAIEST